MRLLLVLVIGYITFSGSESAIRSTNTPFCRTVRTKYDRASIYNRNFLKEKFRWKNGRVPYVMANYFTDWEKDFIHKAIKVLESKTCIKWVPREGDEKPYVRISADHAGCFATLGATPGKGEHRLNLARFNGYSTCWAEYVAIHEMLHNLGMDHEQNRPDRDDYISIIWDNIMPSQKYNFFKDDFEGKKTPVCNPRTGQTRFDDCSSGYITETFGLPYDYESIMQYEGNAFSKNGKDTMISKTGQKLKTNKRITDLDIKKIKTAYCNGKNPNPGGCKDIYHMCQNYITYCSNDKTVQNSCRKTCNLC